ncbi:MAG: putative selenocysteine system protein [Candidatus Helarchaeota archaeon]
MTIIDPADYEEIIKTYPNKVKSFQLDLPPSLAFDVLYHTITTPRSYCIKLDEKIEGGSEDFLAEALVTLTTSSAEQILVKLQGNYEGETILQVWSYDEVILNKFMEIVEKRMKRTVVNLLNCAPVQLEDLRSAITILKELDRVYFYSLSEERYRRIYFMLADSRERLYKILIKGKYGSFNPALIEMQTYLNMLLRHDQDSAIKEPESVRVGLAALKWKRWIIILIQRILNPEEE